MASSATTYRTTKHSPEALPVELVSEITAHLGPQDILSLRLTSRTLESKVSLRHFIPFFTHKIVELDQRRLETMEYVISHSNLGRLLQHCTIFAFIPTDDDRCPKPDFDKYVPLLTKVFLSIKQHCPGGKLPSLCLTLAVGPETEREPHTLRLDHRLQWIMAYTVMEIFTATMAALHESQLPIGEHLDLFSDIPGCGLSINSFLYLNLQFASTPIFSSLKTFVGKFAAAPCGWSMEVPKGAVVLPLGENNQDFITRLLRAILEMSAFAPELESLEIIWYATREDTVVDPRVQLTEGDISKFKCLKECSLRGLMVPEQELLRFMKAVRPSSWTITDSQLSQGTWTSIHRYLTAADSPVTYYHLDCNFENFIHRSGDYRYPPSQVYFDMPSEPKIQYNNGTAGPITLTRKGSTVKEEIGYEIRRLSPKRDGESKNSVFGKRLKYGPEGGPCLRFI